MLIDADELPDDLIDFLSLTGKLVTPEEAKRRIILRSIDPCKNPGASFEFERREDNPFYLSLDVPPPNADVDLVNCRRISQLDAVAVKNILDRPNSTTAEIISAYKNILGWLAFWACRYPDQLWQERFQFQLSERRAGLAELKTQASLRIRLDMLKELEAM